MKALFLNGSPRRNQNTYKLLLSAMQGAKDGGAECELINLYDYKFTGCKSCFACKLKNNKTNGLCAIQDDLRPILEKAYAADVLIIGSPVYFSYPTGQVRNFIERLLFPILKYCIDENGKIMKVPHKPVKTAIIYTMNCPENLMKEINYQTILGATADSLHEIFGNCEVLYSCDTVQFNDYSRYEASLFDENAKLEHRAKQFPIDLNKAYDLGNNFVK